MTGVNSIEMACRQC